MRTNGRELSPDQRELKTFCDKRNIRELIHFVRSQRLASILRFGLLTHSIMHNALQDTEDQYRGDKNSDHICMSIDFPNYKLFYKRKCDTHPPESWCIISARRSLIWERSCIFYPTNAAKDKGLHGQRGIKGLSAMYFEKSGDVQRSTNIEMSHTTNPQAEVLVPDPIPAEMILSVYFENSNDLDYFGGMVKIAGKTALVKKELFGPRSDYKQWSSRTFA